MSIEARRSFTPLYDWTGDSSQWPQEQKMASLEPQFRDKIMRVMGTLRGKAFNPFIVYGWRSEARQAALKLAGKSKVSFSFHNATTANGTPAALAVDIIDRRWGWEPAAEANGFWQALGDAGKAEGLYWGGDWLRFRDVAHLQAVPNDQLAAVRKASGKVLVA